MINETKKYFDENGYVVIQNFVKPEMTSLLYEYMKNKARREMLNEAYYPELFNIHINGRFDDTQAPGAYSLYGDPLMDALLKNSTNFVSKTIEIDLVPTYSYWRLYITDNDLKKHKDRPSCEYSTTLCIGYDVSNLDDKNYNWPIFIKSLKGEEKSVLLKPGDMVIYKGCDVEHWRDKYEGLNHAQVFLHYNKKNGEYGNINDGREFLGLPSKT
tara:strand:- start:1002 stop:1643 length:642 start_codon:yes stop_codon:yes gene_type:complete